MDYDYDSINYITDGDEHEITFVTSEEDVYLNVNDLMGINPIFNTIPVPAGDYLVLTDIYDFIKTIVGEDEIAYDEAIDTLAEIEGLTKKK